MDSGDISPILLSLWVNCGLLIYFGYVSYKKKKNLLRLCGQDNSLGFFFFFLLKMVIDSVPLVQKSFYVENFVHFILNIKMLNYDL